MNNRRRVPTERYVASPPSDGFQLKAQPGISLIELSAFCSFCAVFLGVYLIKRYLPFASVLQLMFTGLSAIIILVSFFRQKLVIHRSILLLLADAVYILFITLQNEQSLNSYLSMIAPILVVCGTVLMARDLDDLVRVLRVWCGFIFTVVLIDFATMLLWPGGMYRTRYPFNWFLGYKTHRLDYSFTLLVLYTCYSLIVHRRLKPGMFWLSALVVADTALSRAAAATAAVAVYVVILFLARNGPTEKKTGFLSKWILRVLKKYRLLSILYLIVTFLIVVLNNSDLMAIIANIFHKSLTFSGRLKIWLAAVDMASYNLAFGNGVLSAAQYSEALDFNNPHNMMLTYLITGGICGTGILFLFIGRVFRMIQKNPGMYFISIYIYCVFLLGFVSSTLSFCPFFFAILVLAPTLRRVDPGYICSRNQWYKEVHHDVKNSKGANHGLQPKRLRDQRDAFSKKQGKH